MFCYYIGMAQEPNQRNYFCKPFKSTHGTKQLFVLSRTTMDILRKSHTRHASVNTCEHISHPPLCGAKKKANEGRYLCGIQPTATTHTNGTKKTSSPCHNPDRLPPGPAVYTAANGLAVFSACSLFRALAHCNRDLLDLRGCTASDPAQSFPNLLRCVRLCSEVSQVQPTVATRGFRIDQSRECAQGCSLDLPSYRGTNGRRESDVQHFCTLFF